MFCIFFFFFKKIHGKLVIGSWSILSNFSETHLTGRSQFDSKIEGFKLVNDGVSVVGVFDIGFDDKEVKGFDTWTHES